MRGKEETRLQTRAEREEEAGWKGREQEKKVRGSERGGWMDEKGDRESRVGEGKGQEEKSPGLDSYRPAAKSSTLRKKRQNGPDRPPRTPCGPEPATG